VAALEETRAALQAARDEANAGGAADDEGTEAGGEQSPSDLMRQLAAAQASARESWAMVEAMRVNVAEAAEASREVEVHAEQQRSRGQSVAAAAATAAAATREELATERQAVACARRRLDEQLRQSQRQQHEAQLTLATAEARREASRRNRMEANQCSNLVQELTTAKVQVPISWRPAPAARTSSVVWPIARGVPPPCSFK
jgi:hypothetical protein